MLMLTFWISGAVLRYPIKGNINKLLKERPEPEDTWVKIEDFLTLKDGIGLFFNISRFIFIFNHIIILILESYEEARKKEKMYSQFNDTESEMEHLMETGRNKRKEFLDEMDFNEFFEPNK